MLISGDFHYFLCSMCDVGAQKNPFTCSSLRQSKCLHFTGLLLVCGNQTRVPIQDELSTALITFRACRNNVFARDLRIGVIDMGPQGGSITRWQYYCNQEQSMFLTILDQSNLSSAVSKIHTCMSVLWCLFIFPISCCDAHCCSPL